MNSLVNAPLSDRELARVDAYWRAANYLTVGQIYLLDNGRLERRLTPADSRPPTSSRCCSVTAEPAPVST